MPSSSFPLHKSLPRLVLRASLLAGALLDSALAIMTVGSWLGLEGFDSLLAGPVSYSRLVAAPLGCRAAIQILACYDRQRYDLVIPITALTLVGSGVTGYAGSGARSLVMTALIVVGVAQLISWGMSRR